MQIDDIGIIELEALLKSPELKQLRILIDAEIDFNRRRLNSVTTLTEHEQNRLLAEINAFELTKSVVEKNLYKLTREKRKQNNI